MTRSQLNIDHVARVEGHGNVHVVIEDDVVKTVEMNIVEPARLFESMVRGQSYKDAPISLRASAASVRRAIA